MTTFGDLFRRATGNDPYPYQRAIGDGGLPELVEVPTGLGKTAAVVMAWLYRRRFHPDLNVRTSTPRRLVFVLPMRVLVEQSAESVRTWLGSLGLEGDIPVRVLMGGEPMRGEHDWRNDLDRDAIVIGTLDMIISRCLNRGYGESRYLWPIDFGLLNSGSHFVFDEVQLMGPALATSRQLHGLRQALGSVLDTTSTWMSATVDRELLFTVDAPDITGEVQLSSNDLESPEVMRRFRAAKHLTELVIDDLKRREAEIAAAAAARHRPGTLTLVIVNTVDRAALVRKALDRITVDAEKVLLHSRFRPDDRAALVAAVTAPIDPHGPGVIVISTQVVEAGVDISATTLITEVAPWPSIVQRAGRCNRDGNASSPVMLWVRASASAAAPYEQADLDASSAVMESLSGTDVDSATLSTQTVPVVRPISAVLRRRDLLELFDTFPDLSGNDVDVSRFIRPADDLDVAVAWRADVLENAVGQTMPGRRERCAVPVKSFREWVKKRGGDGVWRWDPLGREWVRCREQDIRPGLVVLVDASRGGYSAETGWSAEATAQVPVVADEPAADDQSTDDDPASVGSTWVSLAAHLDDTLREAQRLNDVLDLVSSAASMSEAVCAAARLHDIGKAHPQFQNAMRAHVEQAGAAVHSSTLLAKSAVRGRLQYERSGFRHELASALCLLGEGEVALHGVPEPDLVVYLVAAHHGRIRIGVRPLGRPASGSAGDVLGVRSGDQLPAMAVPGVELPAATLDVAVMSLGAPEPGGRSWAERALALRDRADLGPFRLAFLEALVRLADWRASNNPTSLIMEGSDA
jgi:CRISPR-associated endonuclease/helicase Cas3